MRTNQIRLFFSSIAHTLLDALRRLGLTETSMARAQCRGNFYLSETQDCPFGSLRAILGEKCGLLTAPMGSQYIACNETPR